MMHRLNFFENILYYIICNLYENNREHRAMLMRTFGNSILFKVKSNYLMCAVIDNTNSDMKENMLSHPQIEF